MTYLHLLDLIGVFAFALYGARTALHAKFDLFGIWLCGFLTALGGGAIREIMLNQQPIFFHDYTYILVASLGCAAAIAVHKHFKKVEKYVLLLDAIGLVAFAYIGAARADAAGLGVAPIILFALLTAVGGGILADLVAGRKPESLYKEAYPLTPLCLAIAYCAWRPSSESEVALLLGGAFLLRILLVQLSARMWAPHKKMPDSAQRNPNLATASTWHYACSSESMTRSVGLRNTGRLAPTSAPQPSAPDRSS